MGSIRITIVCVPSDKIKASCRKNGHELIDQWQAGQVIGIKCRVCDAHIDKPREWCRRRTAWWKARRLEAVEHALSKVQHVGS